MAVSAFGLTAGGPGHAALRAYDAQRRRGSKGCRTWTHDLLSLMHTRRRPTLGFAADGMRSTINSWR